MQQQVEFNPGMITHIGKPFQILFGLMQLRISHLSSCVVTAQEGKEATLKQITPALLRLSKLATVTCWSQEASEDVKGKAT